MATTAPLVSVVIPMYNAADRIQATLQSVLAQSFRNFEIILVDDGSGDSTQSVARDVLATTDIPIMILAQPNQGPSKARNTGWRAASAPWVQFLDDDDALDSDKLQVQITGLAGLEQMPALIFSCWAGRSFSSTASKQVIEIHNPYMTKYPFESLIDPTNFIPFGSSLVSKAWLEKVSGFDERMTMIEDVDLQIRLLKVGAQFVAVSSHRPLFFYNNRPGSLSASRQRDFVEGVARNALCALDAAGAIGQSTQLMRQRVCQCLVHALLYYAPYDRSRFDYFYETIRKIDASFTRNPGRIFTLISAVIGWRRTELFAARARSWRARFS